MPDRPVNWAPGLRSRFPHELSGELRTLRAAASPEPGERVVPRSPQMIGLRLPAAARAAGVDRRVTAHSGRVGLASELTSRGASTTDVMLAGSLENPADGGTLQRRRNRRARRRRTLPVGAGAATRGGAHGACPPAQSAAAIPGCRARLPIRTVTGAGQQPFVRDSFTQGRDRQPIAPPRTLSPRHTTRTGRAPTRKGHLRQAVCRASVGPAVGPTPPRETIPRRCQTRAR